MKNKFLVAFLIAALLGIIFKVFGTNTSGPITKVFLRIEGSNIVTSSGWKGEHFSPTTENYVYSDISRLPVNLIDQDLLNNIKDKQTVYVQLVPQDGKVWFVPKFVTNDKNKIIGSLYITGTVNGGEEECTGGTCKKMKVFIVYSRIQSSQELLPFTDLFFTSLKDNTVAQISIDKNGNSSIDKILVNDKICITKWKTDLGNEDCWNDNSSKYSYQKKYSHIFLPLLLRKFSID